MGVGGGWDVIKEMFRDSQRDAGGLHAETSVDIACIERGGDGGRRLTVKETGQQHWEPC